MVTNRNTQLALLVVVVGIAVIAGLLFVASQVFDSRSTNLAFEILKNGRDDQVREITAGRTPIPLISDASLMIIRTRWTQSRLSSTAATIRPTSPDMRFLFVDYEIVNDSDDTLLLEGFVDLFNVVRGTATVVTGKDDEAGQGGTVQLYGVKSDVRAPFEVPPMNTFSGSRFYEVDSRHSNLRFRSELVEIMIRLPVDDDHPLLNQ